MTPPPAPKTDADPAFGRAILVAALVEGAFIAAGLAAYFLTGNVVLLFAIAIVGMVLFGVLLLRAFTAMNTRKASGGTDRDRPGPL